MVTRVGDNPHNISRSQSRQDDYTPSEQNGSTDDSLKRRTKYRTTIIIVLVFSCVVALALSLTVVFVLTKPRNEKQGMERYRFDNAYIFHLMILKLLQKPLTTQEDKAIYAFCLTLHFLKK